MFFYFKFSSKEKLFDSLSRCRQFNWESYDNKVVSCKSSALKKVKTKFKKRNLDQIHVRKLATILNSFDNYSEILISTFFIYVNISWGTEVGICFIIYICEWPFTYSWKIFAVTFACALIIICLRQFRLSLFDACFNFK